MRSASAAPGDPALRASLDRAASATPSRRGHPMRAPDALRWPERSPVVRSNANDCLVSWTTAFTGLGLAQSMQSEHAPRTLSSAGAPFGPFRVNSD
jgi:hypothetical protein